MTAPLKETPNFLNIPPEQPFVDCLAKELLRRHGGEGGNLGDVTVLTTTRRAARALQSAFLRETAGQPLLLPRMRPIGDVDEDELEFQIGGDLAGDMQGVLELPPAIDPLRRQLLLARLIQRKDETARDPAQVIGLAQELCKLLDQVQTEGLELSGLKDLVPERYAEHWQITLEFLTLISDIWPGLLEAEGAMDPAKRRDLLLRGQIEAWRQNPPEHPIYAVGSTGSIPVTAELLHLVSRLPDGTVILPGLDKSIDDECWLEIRQDPSHPQYGLARLIEKAGVTRDQVIDLVDPDGQSCPASRPALVAEAMRPATTTEKWRDVSTPDSGATDGVSLINCATPDAEAQVIALKMRDVLNTPNKTAALVTPDRDLSRRVSSELKRWGVLVDDSAGTSLDQSPPGVFLRLTARMLATDFDPIAVLAALKHPYANMGHAAADFRRSVRALERKILRGPRIAGGLAGLKAEVEKLPEEDVLRGWFAEFEEISSEVAKYPPSSEVDFGEYLKAHIRFAEKLSMEAEKDTPKLWYGHFGEAAANFIGELLRATDVMAEIHPGHWPDLLDHLMSGRMVRATYGQHPRLQIWGPIEGRLQRADVMILAGLNKGIWPPEAGNDPWMSRPMREQFTLPLPEKKTGLSAHDFQQAFCGKEVLITRSDKVDGTPTVPSRWLLRLQTLLGQFGMDLQSEEGETLLSWQRQQDAPSEVRPVEAPRPTPPVAARPRQLSVTRIEKWIRDPYSIFADAILKLRPLDEIAEDPGAADRGTFIHKALEIFTEQYPKDLPEDALEKLLEIGRDVFGDLLNRPAVWAFWWPRFERIAAWFIDFEKDRRLTFKTVAREAKGSMEIAAPYGRFRLTGTADRIDKNGIGEVSIVDYKTGGLPSDKEVEAGVSPQLSLEAVMAGKGGFADLGPDGVSVIELLYIRLSGGDPAGEARPASKKVSVEELAEGAYEGLCRLIAQFDKEATPYLVSPRPKYASRFNDYEHLSRLREWSGGDGSDG
ncbi:double-strand break repair protein AddB [Sneathiella sp. P13V-1]|uniref:double-strand break repair protein AddB n=1 Tax=Sneathiella sp. P13V-1 TaxID=2697366 RepID=UPI002AB07C47|nr:double-strand break repair protein AddB [Sneathiella sp. P13V-1]